MGRSPRVTAGSVLVVGAGPAGSAAAITCAQAGLPVTLLESKQFPRDHPGETLHPGVEPILQRLGVAGEVAKAGFLRHRGAWVGSASGSNFEPFGSDSGGVWQGFQVWRADFDGILLRQALKLGVNVRQPCQALRPILHRGAVTGVCTKEGQIHGTYVLDASGGRHWLARKSGLALHRCSRPLIAQFGYVRGECPARDEAPAFMQDGQSWLWTARVRPGVYQWTRLLPKRQRFERDWLPEEFLGMQPVCGAQGADVTWRIVEQCAGPGYFLLGDSAAVLDPASSHGVLRALMSGILAGYLIKKTLRDGAPASVVAKEYRRWMTNWCTHDMVRLAQLYRS